MLCSIHMIFSVKGFLLFAFSCPQLTHSVFFWRLEWCDLGIDVCWRFWSFCVFGPFPCNKMLTFKPLTLYMDIKSRKFPMRWWLIGHDVTFFPDHQDTWLCRFFEVKGIGLSFAKKYLFGPGKTWSANHNGRASGLCDPNFSNITFYHHPPPTDDHDAMKSLEIYRRNSAKR